MPSLFQTVPVDPVFRLPGPGEVRPKRLVRLDQLDTTAACTGYGKLVLSFPLSDALPVSMSQSFLDAFFDSVALR